MADIEVVEVVTGPAHVTERVRAAACSPDCAESMLAEIRAWLLELAQRARGSGEEGLYAAMAVQCGSTTGGGIRPQRLRGA